jgi:glycosyltransferase involved in cell wall biosynthesis
MNGEKLLSVVINNFNYAPFVGAAIESALAQDAARTEIVVVDDGSTDESRDVIGRFADHIRVISKANEGQASALNVGYRQTSGRWIIFLDADDVLLADAAKAVAELRDDVSKLTWAMPIIGVDGQRRPGQVPNGDPASGDLRSRLLEHGPLSFVCAPCSGNAWSRRFLDAVLPIPEAPFRRGADGYLLQLSPLFGRAALAAQPLSAYRRHGTNFLAAKSEFEIRDVLRNRYPALAAAVADGLRRQKASFDQSTWGHPHWDRLDELQSAILKYVPRGVKFVLIDDDGLNLGAEFDGRPRRHIIEDQGKYGGPPADGSEAVRRLERVVAREVEYLVIMWYSFWWLDAYPELASHLESSTLVHCDGNALIWRL